MKKILPLIILSIFCFLSIGITNADDNTQQDIIITVTEKIPWAKCTVKKDKDWKEVPWRWECKVQPWIKGVQSLLWKMIKYFAAIWALAWVLFIVVNWIMLSMWWMDSSLKDKAKKNITWAIIWLVLLLLSWVILKMIAPWVYY